MGRVYSIQVNAVAVTAAQDLFEILAAATKPFTIHELVIGQTSDVGDAQDENLLILFKRATGSYTSGSGGSTPAKVAHVTSDTAAGVTAEANNTTQSSAGSGALTTIRAEPFNVRAGYQYLPTPETRIFFTGSEAAVISIPAPADSLTLSATLVIEEFG
jgi:hypothetical protein